MLVERFIQFLSLPSFCCKGLSLPIHLTEEALFCVPLASEVWLVGTRGDLLVVALHLWNALPKDAHLTPSLTTFRHLVKTVLFRLAFN